MPKESSIVWLAGQIHIYAPEWGTSYNVNLDTEPLRANISLDKKSYEQNKFYMIIKHILILCRKIFKTNKEFGYPLEICCNGIWPVHTLNDYGYS